MIDIKLVILIVIVVLIAQLITVHLFLN